VQPEDVNALLALPEGSAAVFDAIFGYMKDGLGKVVVKNKGGDSGGKGDSGSMNPLVAFVLGIVVLIIALIAVLVVVYHVDVYAAALGIGIAIASAIGGYLYKEAKYPAGVTIVDDNNCIIDVTKWKGTSINDAATGLFGNRRITAVMGDKTVTIVNATYMLDDNTVHGMAQLGEQSWIANAFDIDDASDPDDPEHKTWVYELLNKAANPLQAVVEQIAKDKKADLVTLKVQVAFGLDYSDDWRGMNDDAKAKFIAEKLEQVYANSIQITTDPAYSYEKNKARAVLFWQRYNP
jgi:hypothetical protein